MYTLELIKKEIPIKKLLEFYDVEKLHSDCANCPNYNKIWSCPPHNFNSYDYISQYKCAELYIAKINLDPKTTKREDIENIFEKERRIFSDKLLEMEEKGSEAVIAGNCFKCQVCTRLKGKPCVMRNKMRYSLEALGIKVDEVAKLVGIEIKWSTDKVIAPYLVTVGAIFKK